MYRIKKLKSIDKRVKSLLPAHLRKFNEIVKELEITPSNGPTYRKYHGERLTKVERDRKISEFEVHSLELHGRVRLVYELFHLKAEYKGSNFDGVVTITDIANHEYRGVPYVAQFNGSEISD